MFSVLLAVMDITDESYVLASLTLHQKSAALCNPVDSIDSAFIASTISILYEFQYAYSDINAE